MIRLLRQLFMTIKITDNFLSSKKVKDMSGGALIFYGIFLIAALGALLKEKFNCDLLVNLSGFLFASYIYIIIMPFAILKHSNIKKYFIFGSSSTLEETFQKFTNRSYLIFLGYFAYTVIFPVVGISTLLGIFGVQYISDFLIKNISRIIYVFIVLGSFLWFSYHIVFDTVRLQKIKTKIALFTAIGTTVTFSFSTFISKDFIFIISCLVMSFVWVQYIIELKGEEESIVSKNRCVKH